MEEALEAAATVIKYIGEAVINSKCVELSALVEDIVQAAEAAGVQHEDLSRFGDELKHGNESNRMTVAVNLGNASAAVESIACAQFVALRDSVASLTRECQDFREAYESFENLRRAKAERVQHRARRPPCSGWLLIWGNFGTQQGTRENLLMDVEKGYQSKDLEDSFALTVDLLLTQGRLLKEKSAKLVDQVHGVTIIANGAGVSYLCVELLRAMDVMKQADEPHTLSSVIDLEAAASAMESAVSTLPNVLRDRAAELVRACVELKRAHDAMVIVQQAAAKEQREGQIAGVAAASVPGEQPGLGQGESKRSAMTAYALYGSVTLVTYLGPENVTNSVKGFPQWCRKLFHIIFSLWWTFQAAGVPLSAYARCLFELRCSQILCRLGVLGINLLVILFLYLARGIDSLKILMCLLGGASLLHLFSFALVCWRGDLGK